MRKHTLQFLNRVTILLILYLIMVALPVFAGPNDTWVSCCSSGCDYSPSCNPISFSFGTYYCCNSGWKSSKCPECCSRSNPSVSIYPSSLSGSPGESLTYTVSVKNNDDSSCSPSYFDLTFQFCPSGFTCKFIECRIIEDTEVCFQDDSFSLYISPGATGLASINITSPSSATSGSYSFTVKATNRYNSTRSSTALATYQISSTAPCSRFNPSVSISPSSQTGSPGQTLTYRVTVTNMDSEDCPSTAFMLSVDSIPQGWSYQFFGYPGLTLSPGQSGSITLSITSSSSSPAGSYSFTVKATNSQATSYYGTASATYQVSTTTTTLPPTTTPTLPSCSQVNPNVNILTPFIVSGGNLTVSVYFQCNEWDFSSKNLTLSLKIDNQDWNECFLNNRGLMTDFSWNSNCDSGSMMSGRCGNDNQWECTQGTCKHQNYNLWVKSDFNNHYVNVTFTCKLPYLTGGTHYLNVIATVYSNKVTLKPTTITFRIVETNGRKILEILLFPIKILRSLLPF